MKRGLAFALGTVGLVGLLLSPPACSPTILPVKEPDDCKFQEVTLDIISSPDINRAENGEARPVQLRVYQLKSDTSLQNASFDDVWKKEAETLGEDLVKGEELPVYPNTRTSLKFERDDSAQYVAAVGLFRNPKGRSWYTVFDLPPAPSEGACGQEKCEGEGCEDAGPPPMPHFYVWIDESRVEDGIEHAEDVPDGRVQEVKSQAKAPSGGEGAPGAPAEGAPTQGE